MLTLSTVTKAFNGRRVLDGLTLDVKPARSAALLGANGPARPRRCAASSAWRGPIAGASQSAASTCRAVRSSATPGQLSSAKISVSGDLDGSGNAGGRHAVAGADPRGRRTRDRAAGLSQLADWGAGHLSGGERQRLAMAVAFLPNVDLYLFDEPP